MITKALFSVSLAVIICAASWCAVTPAVAGEECTAQSFDKVGQCHKRRFVKRYIDEQLRGIDPPAPLAPDGIDANLLATQLVGGMATGDWSPVSGGTREWILVAKQADVGAAPTYALASEYDAQPTLIALVKVTRAAANAADGKPIVTVIARSDSLTKGTEADGKPDQPLAQSRTVPCVNPDPGGDDGGYPTIAGQFRWFRVSAKHRVLAATVSRNEGYAGGGGSFLAEILFDVANARLVPVGCYAVSRYQMFGGEWNPDGSRQHPESQAAWTLRKIGKQDWPTLRLQAMTLSTPSATLIWDAKSGHYRER
jgi:hypothetical protein